MRKVYYIYNPQTQTYDRIYPTVRQRALSILRRLFIGMGLGAGSFIVLLLIFGFSVGEGAAEGEQQTAGAVQRALPSAGRGDGSAAGHTAA